MPVMKRFGTVPPLSERYIWIYAPIILALLPFGESLREGTALGAGADVVNTLWTMWWFQHEWSSGAWGAAPSDLFNYPFGGTGAVISPLTATFWSMMEPLFGAAWASILTAMGLLYSTLFGIGFVVRCLGGSRLAVGAALAAFFCQRHFLFTLGDIGVVGVAALPLILGIGMAFRIHRGGSWWWVMVLIGMMALQSLENPYLAPVLPIVVAYLIVFSPHRRSLGIALCMGSICIALLGLVHHAASASEYESLRPEEWVSLMGHSFPVVERPWARLDGLGLLWPDKTVWALGGMDNIHLQGRDYMGITVVAVSVFGLFQVRRIIPWVLLALLGVVLASGSKWGDTVSLFGLMNSMADRLARALTQPTRYLLLAGIGLSISTALTVVYYQKTSRWIGPLIWFLLLVDGCLWGFVPAFTERYPIERPLFGSFVRRRRRCVALAMGWWR